jgi:drug/metabolite transporter (DMT)-like permease
MFSGIFFIILYTGSMACLNLAVKLVQTDVTVIMFCRYNIALLFTLPLLPYLFQRNCSLLLHILRGLSIFVANFFTYYGHKHAPFITANLIGMTEPLFVLVFSASLNQPIIKKSILYLINLLTTVFRLPTVKNNIFDHIHSKHPFTKAIIIGLALGYMGVVLLIYQKQISQTEGSLLGVLSILLANILSACFIFISKYLTQHEKIPTMIVYTTTILWLCGWLIKPDLSIIYNFSYTQLSLLVFIGFIAIAGHFFAMSGLNKLSPEKYSPLLYTRIIFGTILGFLFFQEIITFWQTIGTLLIIAGLYIVNKQKIN